MNKLIPSLMERLEDFGGLSRQGVIATSRWAQEHHLPSRSQQILWLIPASVMIGTGVAALSAAGLGVAPFDVLLSAIERRTPLSFGQAAWAVSAVLFAVAAVLGARPTARSALYIVLNGFTIDVARSLIVSPDDLVVRIVLAMAGAVVLATGVATVVYHAAAGGSFESIMRAAEQHGRRPIRVRTILEISFLAIGVAAGGSFGPMTVVMAVSMGPAIGLGLQIFADHRAGRSQRLGGVEVA